MRYFLVFITVIFFTSCAVFKPAKEVPPPSAKESTVAVEAKIDSLIGQGLDWYGQANDSLALLSWNEALKLNPDIPDVHNYIGVLLKKNGKLKQALTEFQKAIAADSAYYQAINNAGYVLLLMNRFADAKEHFKRALVINPDFEKAKDNLKLVESIQNGELNWDVFSLAENLNMNMDYPKQIKGYQKVLKMDSTYAKAHNNLAVIYYYEGKIDSAFVHLRKAIASNKEYPEAINNLGYLHKQQGNYDLAIRLFFRALMLKPRYIEAMNNLGETYFLKGELENARRVFNSVIELEKDNAVAKQWLARLNNQN